MSYSPVSWSHKDPVTTQKMNQSEENVVRVSEHRIFGCEVNTTGASTIEVGLGRMEIGGDWLEQLTTSESVLTAENAAHWFSASGGEAALTGFYVVAYKTGTLNYRVALRVSGPAYTDTYSGTSIGTKMYDKSGSTWLRYIGYVVNDSGSNLLKQRQACDWIHYGMVGSGASTTASIIINDAAQTTSTTASCRPLVPAYGRMAELIIQGSVGNSIFIGFADTTSNNGGIEYLIDNDNAAAHSPFVMLNNQQEFSYKVAQNNTDIYLKGYYIGNIRGH